MKNADEATTPLEGITVVTEPAAELLNERQQIDYRNQREQCLEWLLVFGKDPKKADGHALTAIPVAELSAGVRSQLGNALAAPIETFELIQIGKWTADSPNHSLAEYGD